MTVAQLIAELQKEDPNAQVRVAALWTGTLLRDGIQINRHSADPVILECWWEGNADD